MSTWQAQLLQFHYFDGCLGLPVLFQASLNKDKNFVSFINSFSPLKSPIWILYESFKTL